MTNKRNTRRPTLAIAAALAAGAALTLAIASLPQLADAQTGRDKNAQTQVEPPTPAEQAELRKANIEPVEQAAFLKWMRAGRPKMEIQADAVMKSLQAAGVPKSVNCVNGDFELGNFTNWTFTQGHPGGSGWNYTAAPPNDTADPLIAQHALVGPHAGPLWNPWNVGKDPFASTNNSTLPIPFPNGGSKVLRLGNPSPGTQGEGANYAFVVTPATQNFGFRYAIVQQDGGHGAGGNPAFAYWLYVPGQGGGILGGQAAIIDGFGKIADKNDPFYTKGPGGWVYRKPSCHSFRIPDKYLGKVVVAMFFNHDCNMGAHGGYAYVDGLCDDSVGKPVLSLEKATYCDNEAIVVDGSKTDTALTHTWTMEQSDAAGTPVAGTAVAETKPSAVGAAFDLAAWYKARGKTLVCGKFYKISLKATTECSTDAVVSKVVFVDCCQNVQNCCAGTLKVEASDLRPAGAPGMYAFNPPVSYGPGLAAKVEIAMMSASVVVTPDNCGGYVGPVSGYIRAAGPVPGFAFGPNLLAQPYSRVVRWGSPGANLAGIAAFPMTLSFPAPQGAPCTEYLQFILKFAVTDKDCKTCEVYKTYYFRRSPPPRPGAAEPAPVQITSIQWPLGNTDKK